MLTAPDPDAVRERRLEQARRDPDVAGAAITGSYASGTADQWSDVDLMLGVAGDVPAVMDRWTRWLHADVGAPHHWDLPSGPITYRVFLLPGWLEVDLGFTPMARFGPLGPNWRTVFGPTVALPPPPAPDFDELAGRAWHHALHARTSIERDRPWQAEHWIGALRGQVIALASLRLGIPAAYARSAHRLPAEVLASLDATLVRSPDLAELRRALNAGVAALAAELRRAQAPGTEALRAALDDLLS